MKWFYKPMGILAAAVMASAVFATSDRLPGQSPTESQPSAESSAEDDALDLDADASPIAESQRAGTVGAKAGVDLDANASPTAESQSRKLKEFKTLDEVRKLYKRGRAPKGSNGDGFTSAASDWGDMMGGMEGMGSMMGGLPPDPREQALSKIKALRKRLKTASEEIQRKIAEQLRAALSDYFVIDMQLRVKELDEIKVRVERMETKLQKRLDSREEAVELQLKLFLRDAEGLGFFPPENSPTK